MDEMHFGRAWAGLTQPGARERRSGSSHFLCPPLYLSVCVEWLPARGSRGRGWCGAAVRNEAVSRLSRRGRGCSASTHSAAPRAAEARWRRSWRGTWSPSRNLASVCAWLCLLGEISLCLLCCCQHVVRSCLTSPISLTSLHPDRQFQSGAACLPQAPRREGCQHLSNNLLCRFRAVEDRTRRKHNLIDRLL